VHYLRVGLAQLNTTVGDFEGNRELILDAGRRGAEADVDLVAYPELALTGYPPEDLLIRGAFIDDAQEQLIGLAEEARGLPPLVVGCLDFDDHLYNSAAVLHEGRVQGIYHKQMLPNYGVFDEERYFHPGHEFPLFEIGGVTVGVTVCEDMWFPGGPARAQALAGAQVIVNLNASPFHADKSRYRERMISTRAADNTVAVVYVNQVGGQDELVFDGNSMVVDAEGQTIARGASMREDLLIADIPVDEILQHQLHESRLRRRRLPEHYVEPTSISAPFEGDRAALPESSLEPPDTIAEVYDALVLGTRDYVLKSGFESVFVAVSGGIDSAIVAAIAVDALGPEHVVGISMPSRYSSEGSIADAVDLAELLGMDEQAVQALVEAGVLRTERGAPELG